ncbi:hypothetical protein V1505DRAFT_21194 [Lipomyces doorenjongii]
MLGKFGLRLAIWVFCTCVRVSVAEFDVVGALTAKGINVKGYSLSALDVGSNCAFACDSLSLLFHNSTISHSGSAYNSFESQYWSQQQGEVKPYCVFRPRSAEEVSIALLLSRLAQCPFAVKSGGHVPFAGASNVQGGVTFDMSALNSISLSENKSVASIGPGNTWFDVYSALEQEELTVIGGRVAAIGVGGLTLGGGISFFSGLHGWACDNVVNFEVVIADGTILDVNESTYPDLYWALRGGGNNFGIVTRFDLETYHQELMWGGDQFYLMAHNQSAIEAFIEFGYNSTLDPNAALIVSFVYAQAQRQYLMVCSFEYAAPIENPPIFSTFLSIPNVEDTTMIQNLSNITLEFNAFNPSGLRQTFWTATYKLNGTLASFIVQTYVDESRPLENVTGIVPACVLQVITANEIAHMMKSGGNALGLEPSDAPLMLLELGFTWEDVSDDDAILKAASNIVQKSVAQAKAWDLDFDYLYMNYASQFQDVIPSYGKRNSKRLASIAKKYDPQEVFQKLQPGYFKLHGAPASTAPQYFKNPSKSYDLNQ